MMGAKYTIKIDTTNRDNKSVCLFLDNNQIDCIKGNIDIVQTIKNILQNNNLELQKDIIEVIPNTGPGSFTGIKTGIVIANTLNWQLGNNKIYKPNYGSEPNITTKKF